MRISPPVVLVLVALVVGSVIAYLRDHSGPSEHDAEQALLDTRDSTYGRRDHAQCVRVDDALPWELACTFQQVGLHGIDNSPLQVMAVDDIRAGHPTGGRGGVSPLPIRCAGRVRCWVRQLCRVNPGCPPLGEVSFPTPRSERGPAAADRQGMRSRLERAWRLHSRGGVHRAAGNTIARVRGATADLHAAPRGRRARVRRLPHCGAGDRRPLFGGVRPRRPTALQDRFSR
jgi:hypothetical protein